VRREVALFQSERVRDHQLVGLALGAAFAALWRAEGEAHARAMLEQASAREDKIGIRWVPAEAFVGAPAGARVEAVTQVSAGADGRPVRRTYVPIATAGAPSGGLLLSESLAAERGYVRTTVVDTVLTTALLCAVSAALSAA